MNQASRYRQAVFYIVWHFVLAATFVSTTCDATKDHADTYRNEENTANEYIVGGRIASAGAFPWYASSSGGDYCGASLVHEDILLSAAHCDNAFAVGSLVYIGANERFKNHNGTTHVVVEQVKHPEFDRTVVYKDFMVARIDTPSDVEPLLLNDNEEVPRPWEVLTTMGFGLTMEGLELTPRLREVDLFAIDHDTCAEQYEGITGLDQISPLVVHYDVMLCAGFPGGGKAACVGDSGSPIVRFVNDTTAIQVGLVSFGVGCGRRDPFAGVFARVSGEIEWIQQQICALSDNPPERCFT